MGVPAGVGSGCAGVRHKFHALLHSYRLTSDSWKRSVELVNSTFSSTGDSGTEKGFGNYKKRCSLCLEHGIGTATGPVKPHQTMRMLLMLQLLVMQMQSRNSTWKLVGGRWGGELAGGQPQEIQGEVDGGQESGSNLMSVWLHMLESKLKI